MTLIYYLIFYFTAYSFIGWVAETLYCSIPKRKFVYRGFLNGPFCPIYGFGAIILILTLTSLRSNIFLMFVLSVIITSVIEYITSWILEVSFHTKLWDYSKKRFNLNGRVCLKNSILFGLMAVIFIVYLHPILSRTLHYKFSDTIMKYTAISFLCYFLIDTAVSVYTLLNINITIKQIHSNKLSLKAISSYENKIRTSKRILFNRILKAFPNMKSQLHHESLRKLKEDIEKLRY